MEQDRQTCVKEDQRVASPAWKDHGVCGGYWKSLQDMEFGGCLPQSVSLVLS